MKTFLLNAWDINRGARCLRRWSHLGLILSLGASALHATGLSDARSKGVFNIGSSQGTLTKQNDATLGRSVLKLDFTAPAGTFVGVWTKDYPLDVAAGAFKAVYVSVKSLSPGSVQVALEIKGANGVQRIPLSVLDNWVTSEKIIDWAKVGTLKEVVFVVSSPGAEKAAGALLFDLTFSAGIVASSVAPASADKDVAGAPERGGFNIGSAEGKVSVTRDDAGRAFLKFDYTVGPKATVGLWTKGYAGVPTDRVNALEWALKVPVGVADRVSVALETKGSKGVQKTVLPLASGWNRSTAFVDWKKIGVLKEVVLVVTPVSGKTEKGTLLFNGKFVKTAAPVAAEPATRLTQAPERGVFNMGKALGAVTLTRDNVLKKDVLKLRYTVGTDAATGVWTKGYGPTVSSAAFNAVSVSVRSGPTTDTGAVMVSLEIKGTKEVQRIPLTLSAKGAERVVAVDWKAVGRLKEVVVAVAPAPGVKKTSGMMWVDAAFVNAELPAVPAGPQGLDVLSAGERGIFNIGASDGKVAPQDDAARGHAVLRLDYTVSSGAVTGVWTKGYAPELMPAGVGSVSVAIKSLSAATPVVAALEIKGTRGLQSIPLALREEWATVEEPLRWSEIGDFKEAVLTVASQNGASAKSAILFDWRFVSGAGSAVAPANGTGTHTLLTAGEKGVFNIGAADGRVTVAPSPTTGQDAVRFDYVLNSSSAMVGVWSKAYAPTVMNTANAVRLSVTAPNAAAAGTLRVKAEIKGDKKTQTIDVPWLGATGTAQALVAWSALGALREAVFVLSPVNGAPSGVVWLELEFVHVENVPVSAPLSPLSRIALVLAVGLALYLLAALVVRLLGANPMPPASVSGSGSVGRDALLAAVWVALAATAVGLWAGRWGSAGGVLAVGGLGVLLSGGMTRFLIRRWPQPKEIFYHFVFSGLLAACARLQPLWVVPDDFAGLIYKSSLTMALVFALYHGCNAWSLVTSTRPLRPVAGGVLVGIPYLFGLLLSLQNAAGLQELSNGVTGGLWAGRTDLLGGLGAVMVVFLFNEFVANAIGQLTQGRWLMSARGHLLLLVTAAAVVVAPAVAAVGSTAAVAAMAPVPAAALAVLTAMISQAGLWMEVYVITGMVLDGIYGYAPSRTPLLRHAGVGLQKGLAFSGLFLGTLYGLKFLVASPVSVAALTRSPVWWGALAGALLYPFAKTIVESFDGSMPFFRRLAYSYTFGALYLRGAVAGAALGFGLSHGWSALPTGNRLLLGFLCGVLASGGVSWLRDLFYALTHRGNARAARVYLVDSLLGGFIGAALAFYLDSHQVPVLVEKFKLYTSAGRPSQDYTVYALLSKWGRVDLGAYTGGAKLFFLESLAGIITWSIAAWLFAINRVFLTAYLQKDKQPIRFFFSRAGLVELSVNMIHVLRWGLWMAPIINSGLRMMAEATWYNQDGAIRTLWATFKNLTLAPAEFQAWSLGLFVSLLSYDWVRVLIWLDHMGLRVATLVNLSFLGMDRLDEKLARFLGPAATQRTIPEGVKRFTTWAPLLIPFYIPRGADWDHAWDASQQIQKASAEAGGLLASVPRLFSLEGAAAVLGAWALILALLAWRRRSRKGVSLAVVERSLANREYRVVVSPNGGVHSEISKNGYDLSRRSYDLLDPAGRTLFVVDTGKPVARPGHAWPVFGNFPRDRFVSPTVESRPDVLRLDTAAHDVRARVEIRLPDANTTAELWTVTLENLTDAPRQLKAVPYLEWVLDRPDSDRGHTQYGRLFPEMEYVREANTILAFQRKNKSIGFLAVDRAPDGFCSSRMDFIGRARSVWSPRLLETLGFLPAQDTAPYPTFDPIGSLLVSQPLGPRESKTIRFLMGMAKNREEALTLIRKTLDPRPAKTVPGAAGDVIKRAKSPLIGHGEIPPGTPQPYSDFSTDGNTLDVHTPYTPRPYDHALSNALGHYVMVTNRGLHTTSSGNSQQNPVTPDWPDTVTRELPAEAIYLYDTENKEWFSPTHHPLNDAAATNTARFGVDGTATFLMNKGTVATELTVFVPPTEPLGVYLLTLKNKGPQARSFRVAPYFQITLAHAVERRRDLDIHVDRSLDAVYIQNPVNAFRTGPAFASLSVPAASMETARGRFFGTGRGVDRPVLVETGVPDWTCLDNRAIAGFVAAVEVPAGEERQVVIVLGQTGTRADAERLIQKYKTVDNAKVSLAETKQWWTRLVSTVRLETTQADFDRYQNWLKYQAVAERLWARRGFYQTSGAFGFRDQLQDSVNLSWVDPALARKQILLHASQQFLEGDVVHWFHTLHDGRTAFSNRSHASDNLLWLTWGVAEYVRLTGDESLLEEMTTYLRAETPFLPLPNNKHGWGTIYPRSTRADTVYRHAMKSVDLVLEKRMGAHGLPLIGTGDWNDGLDEIGSEGRGESVWLGFFLLYILKNFLNVIEKKDGPERRDYYLKRAQELEAALEKTWRGDRYLRAIHDDGTEIGLKDSGVWEIDALTAAWAVMAGMNGDRAQTVFQTALKVLERDNVILLGWPALREDTKPYLGRSSHYPEGVRENGMYCHGVQWMVKAARVLAEKAQENGDKNKAREYRDAAYRLWMKVAPLSHVVPGEIEVYGGQPNKQSADFLTTFDQGRMIWHGYTGAAGWMLRQAFEGVVGASLVNNAVVMPADMLEPRGSLRVRGISRNLSESPWAAPK